MSSWTSYSLQDFIPFSADIYFRLLERAGVTYWPLHLLTMVLGVVTVWLALNKRARLASLLLAPIWAFIAIAFFFRLYSELNWAGDYIAYLFLTQAVLLLLIGLIGTGTDPRPAKSRSSFLGCAIAMVGLIGLPLSAPLSGEPWFQAETFGIHPDPTAVTTLGLVIMMLRGWVVWCLSLIPALWLLYSGLTLWALGAQAAKLLFVILLFGLIGLLWKQIETRSHSQDRHR